MVSLFELSILDRPFTMNPCKLTEGMIGICFFPFWKLWTSESSNYFSLGYMRNILSKFKELWRKCEIKTIGQSCIMSTLHTRPKRQLMFTAGWTGSEERVVFQLHHRCNILYNQVGRSYSVAKVTGVDVLPKKRHLNWISKVTLYIRFRDSNNDITL